MCFSELSRKQEEQGERLYRAVEALKPPAPTADKKTAFWNAYMKLADEHDKEFREKYGTDLDTALIFAGLFSAVSSAFIIQIQPLLVANVPTVIVVVQALQYISLFSALLAALLAVLGKQWIMYYNAAGSRGSIEERGIERQRKLDGLVKWKFEAVLKMFPLLLQLALLLFATSISVYLFTVHLLIAIIVLVLTALGLGAYLFLLVSGVIYPDCPFQTPLTPFLVHVLSPAVAMMKSLRAAPPVWLLPCFASKECLPPTPTNPYNWLKFTPPSPELPAVLWTLSTSTDPITIGATAKLGLDLQWPVQWDLQYTRIVATRLADTFTSFFEEPSISDPVRKGVERRAHTPGRLLCTLNAIASASACYDFRESVIKFHSLREICKEEANLLGKISIFPDNTRLLIGDWRQSPTTRWLLYLFPLLWLRHRHELDASATETFFSQFSVDYDQQPSLDLPTFTNYLCCVCSLLGEVDLRAKVQMDKSDFWTALMTHFFQLLPPGFHLTPRILRLTAALYERLVLHAPRSRHTAQSVRLIEAMLEFCSRLPREHGWPDLVTSAASLTRFNSYHVGIVGYMAPHPYQIDPLKFQPLYLALEHVHQQLLHDGDAASDAWDNETTLAIDGLLQALAYNESLPANLSIESITIILRALSASTDVAFTAYLLLSRAKAWFLDPLLQPVMQQYSVMHHLGRLAPRLVLEHQGMDLIDTIVTTSYVELIQTLASVPGWRSALWPELFTWMALFRDADFEGRSYGTPEIYTSVIRGVWVSEFNELETSFASKVDYCVALTLTALANVWEGTDASSALAQIVQLAGHTVNIAFSFAFHNRTRPGPPMAASYSQLCVSVHRAALNIRTVVSTTAESGCAPDTQHSADRLAGFVEELAEAIHSLFGTAKWDEGGLREQRDYAADRKRLKDMVNAAQKEVKD